MKKKPSDLFRDVTQEEKDTMLSKEGYIRVGDEDVAFVFQSRGNLAVRLPKPSVMLNMIIQDKAYILIALSLLEMFVQGPDKVLEILQPLCDDMINKRMDELMTGPGPKLDN